MRARSLGGDDDLHLREIRGVEDEVRDLALLEGHDPVVCDPLHGVLPGTSEVPVVPERQGIPESHFVASLDLVHVPSFPTMCSTAKNLLAGSRLLNHIL